jgi:hypothetical protein
MTDYDDNYDGIDVEIIQEPLLTDDGLVNPVAIAKIEAFCENMPDTHERMAGNAEWEAKRWIAWREVVGGLAYWGVRQIEPGCDTPYPPHFEKVIGFFAACSRPRFDNNGLAHLSLREVAKMLYDILTPEPMFQAWNDSEQLAGWLDLDALIRNVCTTIRDERRNEVSGELTVEPSGE